MENMKLKIKRIEKGYSQEKLAHLADITVGTYRNIEKNKNEPSIEKAKKIAEILKVSIEDIF